MPRALDLFAGTHSFTKVAQDLGYEVISLDCDPKSGATITADILEFDYKIWPPGHFDFIWASPPCTTFSIACARPVLDSLFFTVVYMPSKGLRCHGDFHTLAPRALSEGEAMCIKGPCGKCKAAHRQGNISVRKASPKQIRYARHLSGQKCRN